jgi:hypothetical protein
MAMAFAAICKAIVGAYVRIYQLFMQAVLAAVAQNYFTNTTTSNYATVRGAS